MTQKADLGELIRSGAKVIDVRTKEEYARGHVNGSINIPLNVLGRNLDRFKDKSVPFITCCASGARSASATSVMKSAGFTDVYNGGSWMSLRNKIKQ